MNDAKEQSDFDKWWYAEKGVLNPDVPMGTELIYLICGKDSSKFDLLNTYLEKAFEAGKRSAS